jgi:hypothetical protein
VAPSALFNSFIDRRSLGAVMMASTRVQGGLSTCIHLTLINPHDVFSAPLGSFLTLVDSFQALLDSAFQHHTRSMNFVAASQLSRPPRFHPRRRATSIPSSFCRAPPVRNFSAVCQLSSITRKSAL